MLLVGGRSTAEKRRRRQRRSRQIRVEDPGPSMSSRHFAQSGDVQGERDNSMLSVADIAALGKVDQAALERCIREDPRFPMPIERLTTGDLYDRTTIYAWAIEAGLRGMEPRPGPVRGRLCTAPVLRGGAISR